MSYSQFVHDIDQSLKGWVVAYDNLPQHAGCVLYLRGALKSIILEAGVTELPRSGIVDLLRETIAEGQASAESLKIALRGGRLTVEGKKESVAA